MSGNQNSSGEEKPPDDEANFLQKEDSRLRETLSNMATLTVGAQDSSSMITAGDGNVVLYNSVLNIVKSDVNPSDQHDDRTPGNERMESAFTKLHSFLVDQLTQDDRDRLCDYFDCPKSRRKRIMDSKSSNSELLNFLLERCYIESSNVSKFWRALKVLHLETLAERVHQYALLIDAPVEETKEDDGIPVDIETDDEDELQHIEKGTSFRDFLQCIGMDDSRSVNLESFVKIKDPSTVEGNLFESFWQRLSSLDYRVRSSNFFKQGESEYQYSIRDFIFAALHCSDSFLRQDIMCKMSACHLAVPVILQNTDKHTKPMFLIWSLRRIIKKWKESNSIALEQHIVKVPMFTVSFLRIGKIQGVSKSAVINTLIGPYQGNDAHSFFITKEDDVADPTYSKGCVESVWYLPMNTNGSEKFKWVTLLLNLRGDSTNYLHQTKFACQASNLTVVFVAENNRKKHVSEIERIKLHSLNYFIVIIKDQRPLPPKNCSKIKRQDKFLFVRSRDVDGVQDEISKRIIECHSRCETATGSFKSLEQMTDLTGDGIDIEERDESYSGAKRMVKNVIDVHQVTDLSKFKRDAFPLQEKWVDWVDIDKERLQPDSQKEESVEFSRDDIIRRKCEKREEQLKCGLSESVKFFREALENLQQHKFCFGYFLSYLQDDLFYVVDKSTRIHLQNIENFEDEIGKLDKLIKPMPSTLGIDASPRGNPANDGSQEAELRLKEDRAEWKRLRQEEAESCRKKAIGWEHFIRELGQWHEAHTELKKEKDSQVMLLPGFAAKLLIDGQSIEIMDGDTGRVPLSWVTSILDKLSVDLSDPLILVLSVIGVQSSGKSTLLNTMFGVRFPVRAGRCTRGLFMRLIKVDEAYSKKLRFQYVFLIDSEGIRSAERNSKEEYRFDNELVTLALCISDVTILNIEGENIGPEMTSLLGIAAHAFIRMKEANMHAQCRIVQQRVSDLTASERNKMNMDQIVETLNNATKQAAKDEGFEDRYQQFSDIFDLRLDKNLQFIPCLWTGPMSPPSQFYSDVVLNIKEDIFSDIESERIVPQFSVSTFNRRIQDVWAAVKKENFLLNFHDSVAALDFNDLCMELNRLTAEMRKVMLKHLSDWQRMLKESDVLPDDAFNGIKQECHDRLQEQKELIHSSLDVYVDQHKRQQTMRVNLKRFKQNLELTVSNTENDLIIMLKNDITTRQLQQNIPSYVSKLKAGLREAAKLAAEQFRTSGYSARDPIARDPESFFAERWEEWKKEQKKGFPSTVVSEKSLEATCENLLLVTTSDKFIYTEIEKLIEQEGGITKHADIVNWKTYFPEKGRDISNWFSQNGRALHDVVETCLKQMAEKNHHASFDANLLQFILQSALQNISSLHSDSEPPYRLKAKVMLHICGRAFEIALKNQRLYEDDNSFEKILEQEKISLEQDFLSFVKDDNQVDRIIECLRPYFLEWGLFYSRQQVEKLCVGKIISSQLFAHEIQLLALCQRNEPELYLQYLNENRKQRNKCIVDRVAVAHCAMHEGKLILQHNMNLHLETLISDFSSFLQFCIETARKKLKPNDPPSMLFREWLDNFTQGLKSRGFQRPLDLAAELHAYSIYDIDHFLPEFNRFLRHEWKVKVLEKLQIPQEVDTEAMANFIENNFRDTIDKLSGEFCFEQCPLCLAPCGNMLASDPSHVHFAIEHLPRGITGVKDPKTSRLVIDDCIACIEKPNRFYTKGKKKRVFNVQNLKKDFPNWSFKTAGLRTDYWKWVMANFNDFFAEHYRCKPGRVPPSWKCISQQDLIDSVKSLLLKDDTSSNRVTRQQQLNITM